MTLQEQFAQAVANARAALEAGDVDKGRELRQQAESFKSAMDELATLNGLAESAKPQPMRPSLPGAPAGDSPTMPQLDTRPAGQDDAVKAFDTFYITRFGDEDAAAKAIKTDLIGSDYRQVVAEQASLYAKYLRFGDTDMTTKEKKLLRRQIFPMAVVDEFVKNGVDIATIKTTMVEAEGTLGGYAVPPAQQQDIITRLPGFTVVRGAGAQEVTLTTNNSTDIPVYTGGDSRYVGNLRGQWGNETKTPTAQNATLKNETVVANLYTYKVGMSQTLVEDAANLVTIVTNDIVNTLALDEDEAFLIGDGVGKPLGLLPGGLNTLSLAEVNSGNATALTADGIKGVKRGVASQYRGRAVWIANSDTYGLVEKLKGGDGQYIFGDLSEDNMLLRRRAYETEAMPDVAASAYPIIFGDMSGYWIVQKAGLAIVRFQDSNTGINKVEYHVRRRVGGRLSETWKFCVQKVSA